ncbi:MAG: aminotransferase class I/II-fold pyridoxal phosphate-dependent enzyme [Microbacteriaceae bacterium]
MSVLDASTAAVSPEWLLERIPGRGAQDIGRGLESLILSGALAEGIQLPTIRALAQAAELSVGTVLTAWNHLRDRGLIDTRRRGGTVVRAPAAATAPRSETVDWSRYDLQQGAPDRALQPDLRPALLDSLTADNLNVFGREYMTERLRAAVVPGWPFRAEAWTTAGGGTEAVLLATAACAPPGSRVAVDEPVSPGFLDTLRDLRLTPVPVAGDEHGPRPDSLGEALAQGVAVFVLQPGAPFAPGGAPSAQRLGELAAVLGRAEHGDVLVVEDDSLGPLAAFEPPTLGDRLPDRVVRVRSYCKAYGIDVRTSVIGGPQRVVERAIALRSHGVGSNSRILQNTLAYLVGDAATAARVRTAAERYALRTRMLAEALGRQGLVVHAGPGSVVLWVEVADETDALVALASRGALVAGASRAYVARPARDMIRLSALQLPEDDEPLFARLAEAVAEAARGRREYFD